MDIISYVEIDPPTPHFSIIIVGGGFSGAVLAAHLAHHSDDSFSVLVIDRAPACARGVAYGTQCGGHLLNVPAGNMSAVADAPDHFLSWAMANYDSRVGAGHFLPRRLYGKYLESVLAQAAIDHPGKIVWKTDEVESVITEEDAVSVQCKSGAYTAEKLVLALGNFPPSAAGLPDTLRTNPRFVANPWAIDALDGVENESSILLMGSGLTGVDVCVGLRARGFKGTIHLLSRRGLLPQKHKAGHAWLAFWNESAPRTTRGLLRLIRRQIELAQHQGNDWRAVIDSLRRQTPAIWHSLPRAEKRRFLRHLRPYWEVHRHRVAPEIADSLEQQIATGGIATHAGRVTDCYEQGDKLEVVFRDRKTGNLAPLTVDRIFNCTGPEADCRKLDSPLLKSLLSQGLARTDALNLGLDVTEDGALIERNGTASDLVYTVGPARKGRLWETTAVPEIRQQIAALSQLLTKDRRPAELHQVAQPSPVLT